MMHGQKNINLPQAIYYGVCFLKQLLPQHGFSPCNVRI
jgi:hypothetical protein